MARVLLDCSDVVGPRMAGPAIRYWELAHALSKHHEVTLRTPGPSQRRSAAFPVVERRPGPLLGYDAVISQMVTPPLVLDAARSGTRVIYDAYDPVSLELLEWHRDATHGHQRRVVEHARLWEGFALDAADFVICASEQQRDLWLGALMTRGRISPQRYAADRSLRNVIDVVPFGLPSSPPQRNGAGFRGWPQIRADDFVVLWAGGVWNWLDPVTAVEAIAVLSPHRDDIKLVFMGMAHPGTGVPTMSAAAEARDRARVRGVVDRLVFFNEGWVPYDERASFLLDANAGISLHADHAESRFAFRTRMLDCIWTGLPVVCSSGDYFAQLATAEGIGVVVAPGDVAGTAAALERLAGDAPLRRSMHERMRSLAPRFTWDRAVQPVLRFLEQPPAGSHPSAVALRMRYARYYAGVLTAFVRSEGPSRGLGTAAGMVRDRLRSRVAADNAQP